MHSKSCIAGFPSSILVSVAKPCVTVLVALVFSFRDSVIRNGSQTPHKPPTDAAAAADGTMALCNVSLVTHAAALSTCQPGITFGCTPRAGTFWVKDGCRGVFECTSGGVRTTCDLK